MTNIGSEQQRVFIMRHGERLDSQDRNWKRTAARPYDTPLTAHGRYEAHRLVKLRLSRKGVDLIFSSPFLRCLQTAHQACLALDIPGVHTYNLLSEVITKENGMKEQPTVPYIEDTTELSILLFDSSPLPNYPEKLSDAHERYFSALNKLADEHWPKTLLLVSHEICVRQAVIWGGSKDDVEASYCGQVELTRKQQGTYDWKLEGYDRVYKYDVLF